MVDSLLYWCDLYERYKFQGLCVDIETMGINKPISLVGIYRPRNGIITHEYFLSGKNLTSENLKAAFKKCKMLITYNGRHFDVPYIRKEFPGVIPEGIPVIDLYLFARRLDLNTNLKVLENTLGISRLRKESKRRGVAVRLWKRYQKYGDTTALTQLIEYNKQDTINLYPIAEKLVRLARTK